MKLIFLKKEHNCLLIVAVKKPTYINHPLAWSWCWVSVSVEKPDTANYQQNKDEHRDHRASYRGSISPCKKKHQQMYKYLYFTLNHRKHYSGIPNLNLRGGGGRGDGLIIISQLIKISFTITYSIHFTTYRMKNNQIIGDIIN